jgi:hypothetical protein
MAAEPPAAWAPGLGLVERDLDRGDAGGVHQRSGGRPIDAGRDAGGAEEHDAVAGLPTLFQAPDPGRIEPDDCRQPAGAIQVDPLIGHAQMAFDDPPTDRLDIDDAGEAAEVPPAPFAEIRFQRGHGLGMHDPVVEGAPRRRQPKNAAPGDPPVDQRQSLKGAASSGIQAPGVSVPGRLVRSARPPAPMPRRL